MLNISELTKNTNLKIGERIFQLRTLLVLTVKDLERATGVSRNTIDRIESGENDRSINNIGALIYFFGFEYHEFFHFDKPNPTQNQLIARMEKFHQHHQSDAYKIVYKQPDLIDLITYKLIESDLFTNWITEKDIFDFCKRNYKYKYTSIPNTLDLAVKKNLLIRHPTASPKQYKKKL